MLFVAFVFTSNISANAQSLSEDLLASFVQTGRGRGVEGRLSGTWPYAPYEAGAERAFVRPSDEGFVEFVRTAADVRARSEGQRSAQTLHALGVLELLWSNTDAALLSLEEAHDLDPTDPRILNDLGVAFLHSTTRPQHAVDILRAFTAFDQADRLRPLPEVQFNLALALENLGLSQQAIEAFRHYTRLDGSSDWAAEAQTHLRRLEALPTYRHWEALRSALVDRPSKELVQRAVFRFSQHARDFAETELLTRWARQIGNDAPTDAAATLGLVRSIGDTLTRRTGDLFIEEAVAVIDRALAESSTGQLQALVEGQLEFGRGVELFRNSRIEEASSALEKAYGRFTDARTPMALSASVRLAFCENFVGDYAGALSRLARLREVLHGSGFANLLGSVYWNEGFAHLEQAHPTTSLNVFRDARDFFIQNGDSPNEAFMQLLVANNLEFLGRGQESWEPRLSALQGTHLASTQVQRTTFAEASKMAWEDGFFRVAMRYLDEALRAAEQLGTSRDLAESYWRRAVIDLRLGMRKQAERDIEQAKLHWLGITDPHVRRRVQGNILLAEAELLLPTSPQRAIELLTSALPDFRDTGAGYFLPDIYLGRARAHAAENDLAAAEWDLTAAITELESNRARIDSPGFRATYLNSVDEIYAEAVLLQASQGNADRALTIAEKRRARTLLESNAPDPTGGNAAKPLDAVSLRSRLPNTVALVEYFVHEERCLAWILHRGRTEMVVLPIGRTELRRSVRYLRALIETDASSRYAEAASELYEILVRPLETHLQDDVPVVLVPDDVLTEVPFAALVDGDTDRYWVEDRLVVVSPSASFFEGAIRAQIRPSEGGRDSVLVVANPAFDRGEHPQLPRLPSAEKVGRKVLETYERGRLLSTADATKTSFLRWAPKHTIVHFGGHALISNERTLMSQLVLAPDHDDARPLFASDIANQRFERTRLLLLAACRSAGGRFDSKEGVGAIGYAFLAAGVPSVIASLWDIDDELAGSLFLSVHRLLARGVDSAAALRQAQLELVRSDDAAARAPRSWATFIHVGPTYRPEG